MDINEDIEAHTFYYNNPCKFVEDVIEIIPTPQQEEILKAFPKHKRVAVRSGHGIGKTGIESWIIQWFMYAFPDSRVVATAPTQHQLMDVLWPELAKWHNKSKIKKFYEWTATNFYNINEPNTWFAVAQSSREPTNFQGYHAENILFIIDEASGVSDEIWEAVRGALTTKNAYCLICGNPNFLSGFFYDAFHKNKDMWKTFHFSSLESPIVDKTFIEEIRRDYGEESNQWRIRVLGEFPLEDSVNLYIPMSLLKYSLVDRKVVWEEEPHADFEYDLGLDPAREGGDEAVFINSKHNPRYGAKTIDIVWGHGFAKSDGPFLMNTTSQLNDKWKYTNIFPDETGMGGFLYDFMKKNTSLKLTPITFNKTVQNMNIKDSNKEAMYKNFKYLLEKQRQLVIGKEKGEIPLDTPDIIRIPNIPQIVTQIATLLYDYNEISGKLKVFHEVGGHDDWSDALCLSLFRYVNGSKRKGSYGIA